MKYLKNRNKINPELVSQLEEKLGLRREVCSVLAMRGFADVDAVDKFLHPFISSFTPYGNYDGISSAAARIKEVIEANGRIVIYGDYDCDGICATAMMYLAIKELGAEVAYYVPHRKKDGYGLSVASLEDITNEALPELIITVDCGITAVEEVQYAAEVLGVEIIITDHHEPQEILPDCIIVNPKVSRKADCFNELCGAGVALKLIEALGGHELMIKYIDLAALATIADIVPLVEDNRIIVNYGIEIINARSRQAIKMLLDTSFEDPLYVVTASDIAYKLIPRINAIGRLSDPSKAVEMFVDDDYFYAKSMTDHAMKTNEDRRRMTTEIYEDCLLKLKSYDLASCRGIVLYDDKWEAGIVGIVSAKIVEKFRRPTILLTRSEDVYKGSARSIDGVNLYECLSSLSSYLISFGGHAMASGLVITPDNIAPFTAAFNIMLSGMEKEKFLPVSYYDIEIDINEVNNKLVDDMAVLEPYGAGNPQVRYLCKTEGKGYMRVGATRHVKRHAHEELELIAFDKQQEMSRLNSGYQRSVIFESNTSVYKNKKYVTGTVMDILSLEEGQVPSANYTAIKHLYQLKYDDRCTFEIKDIVDKDIEQLLTRSIYGTCIIASNNDSYMQCYNAYKDKLVRSEISYMSEENPYNRLMLDIDINQNLEYYKNIIFIDRPAHLGVIDYMRLNKSVNVYMAAGNEIGLKGNVKRVKEHFLPIADMRSIFIKIKDILAREGMEKLSELYERYIKGTHDDRNIEFYLAVYVFFELGILKVVGGKITIDSTVKTSLDSSKIYKGIESIISGD